MTLSTMGKRMGEVLLWYADPSYCFVSATVTNTLGQTETDILMVGQPVTDNSGTWEFCDSALVEPCEGIVVDGPNIASLATATASDHKYLILVRGPAVVLQEGIATTDLEGDAWSGGVAAIVTALEGLSPRIEVVTEPVETETGVVGG